MAKRVMIKTVNAALAAAGHKDVEIVRGDGYFYFAGTGVPFLYSASVYVYHLSTFTAEEWVKEYEALLVEGGVNPPLPKNTLPPQTRQTWVWPAA